MASSRRTTSAASRRSFTFVALLRGINVGGKNKLPMRELADVFVAAGCADVRTYIQSGNVVFSTSAAAAKGLADRVSAQIAERFSLRVPVVLRSAAELGKAVAGNPFLKGDVDTALLHVGFLADRPKAGQIAALDPARSPGDAFAMRDREIYLCLSNSVARSKLTNHYFDSTLGTTSTFRNWRTTLKLLDMVRQVG